MNKKIKKIVSELLKMKKKCSRKKFDIKYLHAATDDMS